MINIYSLREPTPVEEIHYCGGKLDYYFSMFTERNGDKKQERMLRKLMDWQDQLNYIIDKYNDSLKNNTYKKDKIW